MASAKEAEQTGQQLMKERDVVSNEGMLMKVKISSLAAAVQELAEKWISSHWGDGPTS